MPQEPGLYRPGLHIALGGESHPTFLGFLPKRYSLAFAIHSRFFSICSGVYVFVLPLPIAPRMAAGLILFPQCGHLQVIQILLLLDRLQWLLYSLGIKRLKEALYFQHPDRRAVYVHPLQNRYLSLAKHSTGKIQSFSFAYLSPFLPSLYRRGARSKDRKCIRGTT